MNLDKKLNAMRPKDTPLLVLGYIILGMFLFMSPTANADNEIFLNQTGNSLDLTITQTGANNLITSLTGSGTATVTGSNKTFTVSQDGKNNTFRTWSNGSNQFLVADIIGDSNTISMDNHGDNNKLYYWGTGDNNTAHMEIGNNNDNDNQIDLRQYGNNHYAYLETNDDNVLIDAFQGGGSNDGYIYINSNGDNNDITAWQGKHSTGNTDGDETGDHDAYWIVSGSSNVLKGYQTDANRSNGSGAGHHYANYISGHSNTVTHTQKGKAGHDGFIEIDGDNNTVDLYQKGTNGVKWADLVLDGDGHSLDVTQKGGNNTSAAIDLTYGTAAYDFTLLQEATTGVLSYTITGTCVTVGGCVVSVTQSN